MKTTPSGAPDRHAPSLEDKDKSEARIEALPTLIKEMSAMLCGTAILTNRNRFRRKDGSIRVSPEHYTFQYYGTDG